MGAVTHPIDRAGTVFPRGTRRFLVKKGVLVHPFAVSAKKLSILSQADMSRLVIGATLPSCERGRRPLGAGLRLVRGRF